MTYKVWHLILFYFQDFSVNCYVQQKRYSISLFDLEKIQIFCYKLENVQDICVHCECTCLYVYLNLNDLSKMCASSIYKVNCPMLR